MLFAIANITGQQTYDLSQVRNIVKHHKWMTEKTNKQTNKNDSKQNQSIP